MNSNISRTKQSFGLAVGKLLAQFLTFFMPLFLSRFLSKHDYGIYAQFNVASSFILALASFGLPSSIYYFFANTEARQHRAVIYNTVLAMMLGAGIACALLAIPGLRMLVLGSEILVFFPLLLVNILVFISSEILEPFYVIQRDWLITLLYPGCMLLLKVVLVVLLASLLGGIAGVLSGIILTDILICLFTHYYCLRKTRNFPRGPWLDFSLFKRQIRYVVPFGSAVILNTFSLQLDKIICISYLTVEVYASYSLAFFGIPGICQIYAAIGNVYLVSMADAFARNRMEEVIKLFHEMTQKILSFTVPVVFSICLYARSMICFLFTDKYEDAVAFFQVYIFTLIVTQLGTGLIIRASGLTKKSFLSYLYSGVITIPGTFFPIRWWGGWGGIAASVSAQVLPKVLQGWYETRILAITFRDYLPWRNAGIILLISLLALIPFILLDYFYPMPVCVCILLAGVYMLIVQSIFLRKNMAVVEKEIATRFLNRWHLRLIGKWFL